MSRVMENKNETKILLLAPWGEKHIDRIRRTCPLLNRLEDAVGENQI